MSFNFGQYASGKLAWNAAESMLSSPRLMRALPLPFIESIRLGSGKGSTCFCSWTKSMHSQAGSNLRVLYTDSVMSWQIDLFEDLSRGCLSVVTRCWSRSKRRWSIALVFLLSYFSINDRCLLHPNVWYFPLVRCKSQFPSAVIPDFLQENIFMLNLPHWSETIHW